MLAYASNRLLFYPILVSLVCPNDLVINWMLCVVTTESQWSG
jgi:hypothetical protein